MALTRPAGGWVPGNRWDLIGDATPSPLPTVSVIVVHYDQPRQLERTLGALARQDYPAHLVQVIVADDGSPVAPQVTAGTIVVSQTDEGFRAAAARNLGAARATGDLLCFLDADTVPEPTYLRRITRLPGLVPEAVTVGRRRHADLSRVAANAAIETAGPTHALPEPGWLADAYVRSRDLLDADDRSYRYIISAVVACTRWFFDIVGGFDETFAHYGGEDWEWAHRAWRAGAVFAHVSDAIAWHDGPDWAGRGESDAATKNAETLRLARAVPVAGSRPRALAFAVPDVAISLPPGLTDAAAFVCVDAVLHALPHSMVAVPDPAVLAVFDGDSRVVAEETAASEARVSCTIIQPFALVESAGRELAELIAHLGSGERGGAILCTTDGAPVLRAHATRALARAKRWGTDAAFGTDTVRVPGVVALGAQPDVSAWLGGWADPANLG